MKTRYSYVVRQDECNTITLSFTLEHPNNVSLRSHWYGAQDHRQNTDTENTEILPKFGTYTVNTEGGGVENEPTVDSLP